MVESDGSRLHFYKDAAGEWRWTLFAGNNEIIADSGEGYHHKADAIAGALLATGRDPEPTESPSE